MKVKELIEKLQKCNPNAVVVMDYIPIQSDGEVHRVRDVTQEYNGKVAYFVVLLDKNSSKRRQILKSVEV